MPKTRIILLSDASASHKSSQRAPLTSLAALRRPVFGDHFYSVCCFLLCTICTLNSPIHAQNKKDLEQKRQKILKDIEATDRMLQKTTKTKEATYDRFLTLRAQIKSRETLIQTLSDQIGAAEAEIEQSRRVITSLQSDLAKMRDDYGRMLRSAYRRKTTSTPLLFILSAEGLNQAFRRWLFLRKYERYRQKQGEVLRGTQEFLTQKIASLQETRREKSRLLESLTGQKATLDDEMTQQNTLIKTLSQDEKRLKSDLVKKQAAYEVLNQSIERVIQEEVEKRAEAARKAAAEKAAADKAAQSAKKTENTPITVVKPKDEAPKTPTNSAQPAQEDTKIEGAEDIQSAAFRRKRGSLPWPVRDGFVVRGFGRQKHPTLKGVEITNNGIDIRTEDAAEVSVVYAGKVAGLQFIPGHNYTVIVQHGDYYTVYSNLSEAWIKKGETVAANQPLGRVSSNPITGATELHFELWREKERLNPTGWIKR